MYKLFYNESLYIADQSIWDSYDSSKWNSKQIKNQTYTENNVSYLVIEEKVHTFSSIERIYRFAIGLINLLPALALAVVHQNKNLQAVKHLFNKNHLSIHLIKKKSDEQKIEEAINEWLNNTLADGNKIEAAKRIRNAFKNKNCELDLSYLSLDCLPENFLKYLKNLKKLDLNSNKLQFLPSSIRELENLQTLDLSFNSLQELPLAINQLKNLQQIDLRNNKIQELSLSIKQLQNLQQIDLRNNKIQELSPSMQFVKKRDVEIRIGEVNYLRDEQDDQVYQ